MIDKSKSENRKHVLKSQLRLRLNFFQKKLSICTSGPTEENFTTLPRVFRQNSEKFLFRLQKNLLDWIFFKKNYFKLFPWTTRMQFRQSGWKYIKRFKVFLQNLKTVLMKKILSWEKASWKTPHNAVSRIASKIFRESLKPSPSNSDTSIAITHPCRHFFCQKLVIVSLNLKKKNLKFSKIRPFFVQYPEWNFLKQSILSFFPWRFGMQFENFSESFCKKSGSLCSNSETSYESGLYSKKTQMILGKNRMQF